MALTLESAAVALARRPALTAAGLVVLGVVGVTGAARLEVAVDVAKLWAQTVGSEEIPRQALVAAEIDPWGDASDQARVDALVADLAAVPGVAGASTPRTPARLGALDPVERDAAARALLGPIRGVAVQVDLEPGGLDGVAEVVEEMGVPAALVGAPVLDRALTEAARRDQPRVIGLLLALFAVTLWGIFRHAWGVALPLAAVGLNVLAVAGLMGWAGVPLGGATMLLLPMLLVFGIEETVHVVRHYEDEVARLPPAEALERALADVARPCALTNATTAVGFLALIASSSPAVRTFGLLGGSGMAIALFTALAVPAVAFRVSRARPTRTGLVVGLEAWLDRALTWVGRHPRGVWSALGLSLLLLTVAASRARTDLGVVDDLPDGHALHADQAWADALLGGVHPLELTVRFPGGIADLEAWRAALELRRTLAADPAAGAVTSIAEIVLALGRTLDTTPDRLAQKAFAPGPRARPLRVELVRLAGEASQTPLLDLEGGTFTFVVRVHEGRAAGWSALLERVRELDERLPNATIEARGWVPLAVAAWRRIPFDAARVVLSACVALLIALYLADRSPRTAARAILPLVVSLVAVLACLAAVGVPLSYPNLFVLSAVLGVGVDAQIHLVGHYRRHGSLRRAFVTAGASCLSSQLVITAGLLGVVASSVSSVRWAAVVLAIGMATHLIAALAVFALGARDQGRLSPLTPT